MSDALDRVHVKAATSQREAAEFVPFPESRARALARELARTITGDVRFSAGDRALYATDASNHRQVPIGVVIPRSNDGVGWPVGGFPDVS